MSEITYSYFFVLYFSRILNHERDSSDKRAKKITIKKKRGLLLFTLFINSTAINFYRFPVYFVNRDRRRLNNNYDDE